MFGKMLLYSMLESSWRLAFSKSSRLLEYFEMLMLGTCFVMGSGNGEGREALESSFLLLRPSRGLRLLLDST